MFLAFHKQIFAIWERVAIQEVASYQEEVFEVVNCDIFHEAQPLVKKDKL